MHLKPATRMIGKQYFATNSREVNYVRLDPETKKPLENFEPIFLKNCEEKLKLCLKNVSVFSWPVGLMFRFLVPAERGAGGRTMSIVSCEKLEAEIAIGDFWEFEMDMKNFEEFGEEERIKKLKKGGVLVGGFNLKDHAKKLKYKGTPLSIRVEFGF